MSKVKSIVITVLLALVMAAAAFFAVISFPVGNVKRFNSIASSIALGGDFTGYAYTTVYPKGVITAQDYNVLSDEDKSADKYEKVGSLYVEKEKYADVEALKASVKKDAEIINGRFGEKGYSSYSVAVEDGLGIKISAPTGYSYAQYKDNQSTTGSAVNDVSASLASMVADGTLTLRTTDSTITLTGADGSSQTYVPREDNYTDSALVSGDKTYSIAGNDDVAEYFKSITSTTFGKTSLINFNFTKEGRQKFADLSARAAASSSKNIYFFVGDTQLVTFKCESAVDMSSLKLQADSRNTAENAAIAMQSVLSGNALTQDYEAVKSVTLSEAFGADWAAAGTFLTSVCVLLVALIVAFVILYKKLGAVNAMMLLIMILVQIYALYLLSIQVTFGVLLACFIGCALFMVCNALVFAEVKRLVATGRTMQASIKEAYKNLLTAIIDIHVVAVAVAILLATVGVGEVAACGLISVISVVASFVLYWFTRLMWYVISSPVKDKFGFAGLKRVVYEDD